MYRDPMALHKWAEHRVPASPETSKVVGMLFTKYKMPMSAAQRYSIPTYQALVLYSRGPGADHFA